MDFNEERRLKFGMIWNSVGSLFYYGCQWLITILVVRLSASYENAGHLSLAMSIANIFTPFALYRMRTYQVTDVNNKFSAGEYLGFRIETSLIALVFCAAYSFVSCPRSSFASIVLYLCFKTVEQLVDVMHGVDQRHNRLEYAGRSLLARGVLTLTSFSAVLLLSHSLEIAIVSMAVVSAAFSGIYDVRRASMFESLVPVFSFRVFNELFRSCFSVAMASVLVGFVMTIPKQIFGNAYGQELLGIYSSIASPVAIVQLGASYLYGPLLGHFAMYYVKREKEKFTTLYKRLVVAILVIGVVCCFLLQNLSPIYLPFLFGADIAKYSNLVLPMVVCSLVTAFYLFSSDLLLSVREFRVNAIAGITAFLVAIPLSILCVKEYGMNGISFSGIIAYGIGIVISVIATNQALAD